MNAHFKCPGCRVDCSVTRLENGDPAIFHPLPACSQFLDCDAEEFVLLAIELANPGVLHNPEVRS